MKLTKDEQERSVHTVLDVTEARTPVKLLDLEGSGAGVSRAAMVGEQSLLSESALAGDRDCSVQISSLHQEAPALLRAG